jgi:hypothetical protein
MKLRKIPYPFSAMLAFSSDIDGTNESRFIEIKELFKKYNLEFADSFWFYNNEDTSNLYYDTLSYYNLKSKKDEKLIVDNIKSGNIDALHSYGNWSNNSIPVFSRFHAIKALNELKSIESITNRKITVWINHGDKYNSQNFGQEGRIAKKYHKGDIVSDPSYHTDLLSKTNIKFVWSRSQSSKSNLMHSLLTYLFFSKDNSPIINKLKNLFEVAQVMKFGNNSLIYPIQNKDHSRFIGFTRFTENWHLDKLHKQISKYNLDNLIKKNKLVIIANHFGYTNSGDNLLLSDDTINSLEYLSQLQKENKILVTRQSKLLNYNLTRDYIRFKYNKKNNSIIILYINDPIEGHHIPTIEDLRGVSFDGANENCKVYIGHQEIKEIKQIGSIVMIPWL